MIKKIKSKFNFLKSQGVGYNKFIEFSQELAHDADEMETISLIVLKFYPTDKRPVATCLTEFHKKTSTVVNYWLNLNLDFENMPAHYFIKADFYCANLMLVELYNHLAGANKKDIPTQMAQQVRDQFLKAVEHFKDKYEYVYNPPITGKAGKATIGSQYRQEFSQHYGAYAEITYTISKGDPMKFEDVEKMRLENYLSLGNYLIHKQIVENIE